VFARSGTAWSQQAYLKAHQVTTYDQFGHAVAVSGDTVVVGAYGEDSSTTGVTVNGTPNESADLAGAAYVFVRSGTTWTQQAYLKASQVTAFDLFGTSVAVSGDTVVVGANYEDSSTTGVNSTPNDSAANPGAAYVFVRSGTTWTQQAYLKASQVTADDNFGFSVAVSGDTVVVGAYFEDSSTTGVNSTADERASNSGAVFVFTGLGVATVTTPTSASIAATSATLGGNVTSAGGATITARGIVYSQTATNNNPQIGGTGVTNVVGSGTTGVFTVTASGLTATTTYTYAAYATTSAGTTYSSTGTFTTLNAALTLAAIAVSGTEDTTLTFTATNFTGAYTHVDSTALVSITVATLPATGLLKLSGTNVTASQVIPAANLANLTYVPAANETGAKTFTVTASDGTSSSAAATVTMTLAAVNDAPSFALPVGTFGFDTATWTARAPGSRFWRAIASSADGTKLAAVVEGGQIYTSIDSGATWTARESNRSWYRIASSADGTKLAAVDYNGQIYTSTDSGATWTAQASGSRQWLAIASSADGTKLTAAGYSTQIYTSTDSGATWTARASSMYWHSIASSADGTKLAAGVQGGQIYTSTDSGATWTAQASGSLSWFSIASSADGTKLAAGVTDGMYGGQIYTSTDSGATWTARESIRNWYSIASSADGTKLAAGANGGQIYTSTADTRTVLEDAGAQSQSGFATSISAGPADEAAQTVAFTLTNDNNALFSSQPAISAAGMLTFTPAANANGSATVTVTAQDNGGTVNGGVDTSAAQTFTLTVTAVNDAPVITSNSGGATAAINVAENTTAVTTVIATDADLPAQGITYSITGGADLAQFSIVAATGALTFATAPNFEVPTDVGADNVYDLIVTVTDDGSPVGTKTQTIAVTVTNANEAPVITGNSVSIPDGDSTPSTTDHTDFGSALVTGGTVVRTFTIANNGTASLTLSGTPKVAVSGTHAADFTVTALPTSPVTASGSTTFQVTFDPSASGTRTATLTLVNDDNDVGIYDFAIQGTGVSLFATWQTLNGAAGTIAADHDNDGVPDVIEYFVGGPNGNTTGQTTLPSIINNSGTLSITWIKGTGYPGVYGSDYLIETSTTLTGTWTPETVGVNVALTGNNVTYTFPAASGDRRFVRLKVMAP
jgi:photosystem II stability/assembly factor-like uncharacterized protein